MTGLPITLDAALRDLAADDVQARNLAAHHLAAALLAELGEARPQWRAAARHPRGPEAVAALQRALDDPAVPVRALAATGLGLLGDPGVLPRVEPWLRDRDPGPDAGFLRECAAIACVLLGHAARPVPEDLAQTTYQAALACLREGLSAASPDLRFQAAGGLAELAGAAAEPALCDALAGETHPRVRAAIAGALAELAPPGPRACAALAPIVADATSPPELAFAAALGLTAAGDPRGGPILLAALGRPEDRGRALEALAVLGPVAPPAALRAVQKIARGWLTPAVMRVRAAYALTRMSPRTGEELLTRLGRSRRPAVREAVADARAALLELAARDAAR